jgi:hypothetical protein
VKKRIYVAPDEFTAITIQEMLKGQGIEAEIQRFETAWLDGLAKVMKGGWGEVLVEEGQEAAAESYIKEFLESPANEEDFPPFKPS